MRTLVTLAVSIASACYCTPVPGAQNAETDDIVQAWEVRSSRYESVRIRWNEIRIVAAGSLEKDPDSDTPVPETDLRLEVTYDLKLKMPTFFWLLKSGPSWYPLEKQYVSRRYESVFDGSVAKSFYGGVDDDPKRFPSGFISGKPSDWDNYHVLPVLLFLRPLNPVFSPITAEAYETGDIEFVEGHRCIQLRPKSEASAVSYLYLVDPENEFVIRKFTKVLGNHTLWSTEISYRSTTGKLLIESWETQVFAEDGSTVIKQHNSEVSDWVFDSLSGPDFAFEFPENTLVTDRSAKEQKPGVFIAREGGARRIVTSAERREGIQYARYLNSNAGEAVDFPESRFPILGRLAFGVVVLGIIFLFVRKSFHANSKQDQEARQV